MKIEPIFKIGEIVYFVTDQDQKPFIVTAWIVLTNDILYRVCHSDESPKEAEYFEITNQKIIK